MKTLLIALLATTFVSCSTSAKKGSSGAAPPQNPSTPAGGAVNSGSNPGVSALKRICTLEKDERILEARPRNEGCELGYMKSGKEKIAATGHKGLKHCREALEKISKKLESQTFQCHDV